MSRRIFRKRFTTLACYRIVIQLRRESLDAEEDALLMGMATHIGEVPWMDQIDVGISTCDVAVDFSRGRVPVYGVGSRLT